MEGEPVIPRASRTTLRREMRALVGTVGARMGEYFDGYVIIGVRAGDHDTAGHVLVADGRPMRERVENTLLAIAADIMRKREEAAKRDTSQS